MHGLKIPNLTLGNEEPLLGSWSSPTLGLATSRASVEGMIDRNYDLAMMQVCWYRALNLRFSIVSATSV